MTISRIILTPLLVMVLLTCLAGGTAYQQIWTWDQTAGRVLERVSGLMILNNIRWELKGLQQQLQQDPEQATLTWHKIQQQRQLLSSITQHQPGVFPGIIINLDYIGSLTQPKPADVVLLLHSDLFTPLNFNNIQEDLQQLQKDSKLITGSVTLLMSMLGLLLAAITAYDLSGHFRQLARSRDLSIELQEDERRRIAQELHDGAIQELIDLKRQYSPEKADRLINTLRRVCHNLKPQILDDLGLAPALEFLADDLRQAGVESVLVTLDHQALDLLPKEYELPLFRVVQELCSNIKHHAQASQVQLTVAYNPMESPLLRGYVSDNGKGFDPGKPSSVTNMGLVGIQERLRQLGGQLKIQSAADQGSKFQFSIPVKRHVPNTRPA